MARGCFLRSASRPGQLRTYSSSPPRFSWQPFSPWLTGRCTCRGRSAQVSTGKGWGAEPECEGIADAHRAHFSQCKSSNQMDDVEKTHRNVSGFCPKSLREVNTNCGTDKSGVCGRHAGLSLDRVHGQLPEGPQVGHRTPDAHEGLVEIIGQASGPEDTWVIRADHHRVAGGHQNSRRVVSQVRHQFQNLPVRGKEEI